MAEQPGAEPTPRSPASRARVRSLSFAPVVPISPIARAIVPGSAYTLTGQVNHPSPDACLRAYLRREARSPECQCMSSADGQMESHAINTLYFYLTEGCNLACRHCWLAPRLDATGNRYPTLPVEMFETAIREARAARPEWRQADRRRAVAASPLHSFVGDRPARRVESDDRDQRPAVHVRRSPPRSPGRPTDSSR